MSGINLIKDQRRWAILTITLLALGGGWTFFSRLPASAANSNRLTASPRQGFAAPDFTLDLLGGGEVTLSDLRGAPVMLNLWASWCPPCRAEMPAIQSVYQEYRHQGLVVLAVNTTRQDSEAAAAAFIRDHGLTFGVIVPYCRRSRILIAESDRYHGKHSHFTVSAHIRITAVRLSKGVIA